LTVKTSRNNHYKQEIMKRLFFLGLLLLTAYCVNAQNNGKVQLKKIADDFAASLKTDSKIAASFKTYKQKIEAKNYDGAITALDNIAKINPKLLAVYDLLGDVKCKKGDLDDAVKDYDVVLKSAKNPETFYKRGNAFYDLKKFSSAVADYDAVVMMDTTNIDCYYSRGKANYICKNYESSYLDFMKVKQMNNQYQSIDDNISDAKNKILASGKSLPVITQPKIKQDVQPQTINVAPINNEKIPANAYDSTKHLIDIYTQFLNLNRDKYPEVYFNRGKLYEDVNDIDNAIIDYTQAINLLFEGYEPYYRRATLYYRTKRNQKAYDDFKTIVTTKKPDHSASYYNMGLIKLEAKLYDNAIENFSKVIKINIEYVPEALVKRAEGYFDKKMYKLAIDDLENARSKNYKGADALIRIYNDKIDSANAEEKYLSYRIKKNPADPKAYYDMAVSNMGNGDYVKAFDNIQTALKLDTEYVDALKLRATIHENLNDTAGVINDWTVYIQKRPKNPEGYFFRAESKRKFRKIKETVDDYTKAIQFKYPAIHQAYFYRALAHESRIDLQKAFEDWNVYITLKPNDPDGYIKRANIKRKLKLKDQLILEDFNKAVSFKNSGEAYYQRGMYYKYVLLDDNQACSDFRDALKIDKDHKDATSENDKCNK